MTWKWARIWLDGAIVGGLAGATWLPNPFVRWEFWSILVAWATLSSFLDCMSRHRSIDR